MSFADTVEQVEETDSTMELARARALAGAPHGLTIVARRQRAGRGRRGRSWTSPDGAGLLLTTLLRPPQLASPPSLHQLGVVAGVAAWRAVQALGAEEARLKWPNDVLVGSRKLAGILLEAEGVGGATPFVLVGVGLNLAARQQLSLPAEVEPRYVGLAELVEPAPTRERALAHLITELERAYDEWMAYGPGPALATFAQADALVGERVRAEVQGGTLEGIARGLTPDGALIVEGKSGPVHLTSGEVSLVRFGESV